MACNSTLDNLPENWDYVLGTLMAVTAATATFENMVVLLIMYKNKDLSTPSYKILRSLAAADFLTGSLVAPLHMIQYFDRDTLLHNCIVELVRRYLSTVFLCASAFTVGFISYDRCVHLVCLQRYKMPTRRMYVGLGICWAIPVLMPLLRLVNKSERVYSALIITLGVMMLFTIMTSYIGVMISLRIHARRSLVRTAASSNGHKAGMTVAIIITFYILMLMPIITHHGLNSSKAYDEHLLAKTYNIGMVLAIANSSVNPLIYFLRNNTMRNYVLKLFHVNNVSQSEESETSRRVARSHTQLSIMSHSSESCGVLILNKQ